MYIKSVALFSCSLPAEQLTSSPVLYALCMEDCTVRQWADFWQPEVAERTADPALVRVVLDTNLRDTKPLHT